jgi:(p)ppGpp synthase/HD superfamily hydrolase
MEDLVKRALKFATEAHGSINHVRKYTGVPYITHPIEVMNIVKTVPHTQEMLAAALLHDTVEDTPVTIEQVREEFGPVVARLVSELTDVSTPGQGNRAIRKGIDLAHTASASPQAATIKLADLLSNSKSIVEHDKNFAKVYLREKSALLDVLTKGDKTLHAQAVQALTDGILSLGAD